MQIRLPEALVRTINLPQSLTVSIWCMMCWFNIPFICLGFSFWSTNTVKVTWWLSSFTGGGTPQVPLRALFQARTDTWVEPPTFHLTWKNPNPWRDSNLKRWWRGANDSKWTILTTWAQTPQLKIQQNKIKKGNMRLFISIPFSYLSRIPIFRIVCCFYFFTYLFNQYTED